MRPTPRLTVPKVVLALCLLFLTYPLSLLVHYARADEELRTALLFIGAMVAFATAIFCAVYILASGPPALERSTTNAAGEVVFPLPAPLAQYLETRPELVDAQARHGGLPVPIAPETLQTLVAVNAEFMRGAKTTEQEKDVGDFMTAVFKATAVRSYDGPADAADKC